MSPLFRGSGAEYPMPFVLSLCLTHYCYYRFTALSGTTRVSRYQSKHSPTHTYPDHQSSFICFLCGILCIYCNSWHPPSSIYVPYATLDLDKWRTAFLYSVCCFINVCVYSTYDIYGSNISNLHVEQRNESLSLFNQKWVWMWNVNCRMHNKKGDINNLNNIKYLA